MTTEKQYVLSEKILKKHSAAVDVLLSVAYSRRAEVAVLSELIAGSSRHGVHLVQEKDHVENDLTTLKFSIAGVPKGVLAQAYVYGGGAGVFLLLYMRPFKNQTLSKKLLKVALENPDVFNDTRKWGAHWQNLHMETFIPDDADRSFDDRLKTIIRKWSEFCDEKLPRLKKLLK